MPKMHNFLLKLGGFKYSTSLGLNMGYYHICLSEEANNIYTIILPWGNYRYKFLQMDVSNSLGIFQEKVNEMFQRFEFIRAYIDDLLLVIKGYWYDHLKNWNLRYKILKTK